MLKYCQSCGMPMFSAKSMSVNKDGSVNEEFCSSCYRFGKFAREQG